MNQVIPELPPTNACYGALVGIVPQQVHGHSSLPTEQTLCERRLWLKIVRAWCSKREQLALQRHRERLSNHLEDTVIFPHGESK